MAKDVEGVLISEDEKKLCDLSITYLERLLAGHNPVNNREIDNDSVLTDENVQKCFAFVVDILGRVSSNADGVDKKRSKRNKVTVKKLTYTDDSDDVIAKMIQEKEISMLELESVIKKHLSELFVEEIEKISAVRISNWLVDSGYLIRIEEENGEHHREATENGKIIGMTNNIVQNGEAGSYVQYRFTPKAQRFIFENLEEIAFYKKKK